MNISLRERFLELKGEIKNSFHMHSEDYIELIAATGVAMELISKEFPRNLLFDLMKSPKRRFLTLL